jgi:hypothetical protein
MSSSNWRTYRIEVHVSPGLPFKISATVFIGKSNFLEHLWTDDRRSLAAGPVLIDVVDV